MESAATYCGTVYPWQCDQVGHMNIIAAICETTGVRMDRQGAQIRAVCRFDPNDRRNTARRFRAGRCVRRQIYRARRRQ